MTTDTEKRTPIFATKPVEDLLNGMGSELRALYQFCLGYAQPTDLSAVRDMLLRFDRWHDSVGEFDVTPKDGEPTGYRLEPMESVWRRAGDIKSGDVLDLQGDQYADTKGDDGEPNHPGLQFEYVTVEAVEFQTPDCVVIYNDEVNCAFPVDHLLKFVRWNAEAAVGVDYLTARAYSDDHNIDTEFNAAEWFQQASDDDIRALAKIGFGGNIEADAVAQFYSDDPNTLKDLFAYVKAVEDCGYECYVDVEAALAWLRQYRPALHAELTAPVTD